MDIKVKGLDKLANKVGRIPLLVDRAAVRSVRDEALAVAADERRLAPRDTGALVDSIQNEVSNKGLTREVYPTVDYADDVNNGSRSRPPQPFATAAAKLSRRRFPKRAAGDLDEALRKLGRG